MRGNSAPGVNEPQTGIAISLRAGGPQIEQHNVAPFAQFVQIAELEFAADVIFERTSQCPRDRTRQARILAYKTHVYNFISQGCALRAGLRATRGEQTPAPLPRLPGRAVRNSIGWAARSLSPPAIIERTILQGLYGPQAVCQ